MQSRFGFVGLERDATPPRAGAQPRHDAARDGKFQLLDLLRVESDGDAVAERVGQRQAVLRKDSDLVAAEAGVASSERSRLRMGSKATVAAAGSLMTWISSMRR